MENNYNFDNIQLQAIDELYSLYETLHSLKSISLFQTKKLLAKEQFINKKLNNKSKWNLAFISLCIYIDKYNKIYETKN